MRFSIIIPTFNRPEFLQQAIESALAQTYADREILVVDDGSRDDTRTAMSRFGSAVGYLRQENSGKSAALNLGIQSSRGDIIVVLDDDDIYPKECLAKHARALEDHPLADFSYGRFQRFWGKAAPSSSQPVEDELVPTDDPRRLVVKLMENCFLPNPAWAVRREAQLAAGPYDGHLPYSHDYDMVLRFARRNEGAFVDDYVLLQRKHESVRGPVSEQTLAIDTIDKWLKYDKLLFEGIGREWSLDEFRPFPDGELEAEGKARTLLQKGVILFQRKVYDQALAAFDEYRRALGARAPSELELRVAIGLLGCRYGIADLVKPEDPGASVAERLKAGQWPRSMRLAMASQLRWRVRKAVAASDLLYARNIIRFSRAAFGIRTTAAVLGSRSRSARDRWRGFH